MSRNLSKVLLTMISILLVVPVCFGQLIVKNSNDLELMRVTNAGKVGIGTSTPTGQLGVSKSSGASFIAIDSEDGVSDAWLALYSAGVAKGQLRYNQSDDVITLANQANIGNLLNITSNGKVGINTLNPLTKFMVAGSNNDGVAIQNPYNTTEGRAASFHFYHQNIENARIKYTCSW